MGFRMEERQLVVDIVVEVVFVERVTIVPFLLLLSFLSMDKNANVL